MLQSFILTLCFHLPLFAMAADVSLTTIQIKTLRLSDTTQTLYLKPTTDIEIKNESCALTDYYAISADDPTFNQMHSILLAAGTADRKVKLWISDTAGDCVKGQQRIAVIEIQF